jgi:hypothetical protein
MARFENETSPCGLITHTICRRSRDRRGSGGFSIIAALSCPPPRPTAPGPISDQAGPSRGDVFEAFLVHHDYASRLRVGDPIRLERPQLAADRLTHRAHGVSKALLAYVREHTPVGRV